jgi:hypothetical protein
MPPVNSDDLRLETYYFFFLCCLLGLWLLVSVVLTPITYRFYNQRGLESQTLILSLKKEIFFKNPHLIQ